MSTYVARGLVEHIFTLKLQPKAQTWCYNDISLFLWFVVLSCHRILSEIHNKLAMLVPVAHRVKASSCRAFTFELWVINGAKKPTDDFYPMAKRAHRLET